MKVYKNSSGMNVAFVKIEFSFTAEDLELAVMKNIILHADFYGDNAEAEVAAFLKTLNKSKVIDLYKQEVQISGGDLNVDFDYVFSSSKEDDEEIFKPMVKARIKKLLPEFY